uniref:Uncharacterized protein, isoform D n=1 Tax=Drosophila pseudoobscura pseudoobscura TaxID=46245 RepID=A0A0R3P335_DROPS
MEMEMARWPLSTELAGLVVGLLLLFCDDGMTSRPSVVGSIIGLASKLGPTCNKMLRLVARQVLERLICECIDTAAWMLMATAIGPSTSPIWQELDGEIGAAAAGEAALSEAWQRQPVVWMLLATAIGPSNFAHLAGIGWRNWCGSCWRGSSIGGVAVAALDLCGGLSGASSINP